MIIRIKGSHDIFRKYCQYIRGLTNELLSDLTTKETYDDTRDMIEESIEWSFAYLFYGSFIPEIPQEHFAIYPSDELDEELLSDFSDESEDDSFLPELAFHILKEEIVDRLLNKKLMELIIKEELESAFNHLDQMTSTEGYAI